MLEHASIQPWALVRSGSDIWQLGLAHSQRFNESQRCSMGLSSGLCGGQWSSSTQISRNDFCMDLALCTWELLCWNRKGPSPNCCYKFGCTESSRMSWSAVALIFPFTGTKGPSPKPWKTAPDPYCSSTKLYSLHYALGQGAFSWHSLKQIAWAIALFREVNLGSLRSGFTKRLC
jgi:hypothetical protein